MHGALVGLNVFFLVYMAVVTLFHLTVSIKTGGGDLTIHSVLTALFSATLAYQLI